MLTIGCNAIKSNNSFIIKIKKEESENSNPSHTLKHKFKKDNNGLMEDHLSSRRYCRFPIAVNS